jgi:hypothetical protein
VVEEAIRWKATWEDKRSRFKWFEWSNLISTHE